MTGVDPSALVKILESLRTGCISVFPEPFDAHVARPSALWSASLACDILRLSPARSHWGSGQRPLCDDVRSSTARH